MSDNEQMSKSASEPKTVIHHMRMAKADDADMDVAFRLIHLVDAIGDDYYPGRGENTPTFFDEDNFEHLQHLHRQIKEIAENSGSLHRIAGAASVLLNPKNNLIDPDDHCIELHPDLKAAQQAADEVEGLRAKVSALEELAAQMYQIAGALGASVEVMDNLHAAADAMLKARDVVAPAKPAEEATP